MLIGPIASSHKYIPPVPQNLLLWSEQINNAAWSKAACTITADAINNSDGALAADKIVETTANSTHQITQSYTVGSTGVSYTLSCEVKAAERSRIMIILLNQSATSQVTFDLIAVTASQTSGIITPLANGWFKISVTDTALATGSRVNAIRVVNDIGATSYVGDAAKGVYVTKIDLCQGQKAYAQTTGTIVP